MSEKKEKKKTTPGEWVIGLVVIGIFLTVYVSCTSESDEEKVERLAKEKEDRTQGFHCLSSLNGSHRAFTDGVQKRLRDPDSFEHVETLVTPVDANGTHIINMSYRARNGFGGMTMGTAIGTYRNSDCQATITSIE